MNKTFKKLKNRTISGRLILVTIPEKLDVAKFLSKISNFSICKTIQQRNFNLMSVHKILKQIKFYPYKIYCAN